MGRADVYLQPDAADPVLDEAVTLRLARPHVPDALETAAVDESGGDHRPHDQGPGGQRGRCQLPFRAPDGAPSLSSVPPLDARTGLPRLWAKRRHSSAAVPSARPGAAGPTSHLLTSVAA